MGVEERRSELKASLGDLADAAERGSIAVGEDLSKELGGDVEPREGS